MGENDNSFVVSEGTQVVSVVDGNIVPLEESTVYIKHKSTSSSDQNSEQNNTKQVTLSKASEKNTKKKIAEIPISKAKTIVFNDLSDSESEFRQHINEKRLCVSSSLGKFKVFLSENFTYYNHFFLAGKIKIYCSGFTKNLNKDKRAFSIRPPPIS